jgi:predicted amidohydrolase YtcJ
VSDLLPTLATFPSLDQAESALDWIGVEFSDGDGCFEGTLAAEDADLLDDVLADADTPEPVRALAAALRTLLPAAAGTTTGADADAGAHADVHVGWRVAFTA